MFRLRCVNSSLRRLLHGRVVNQDQVLEQLRVCSAEEEVFDVVGKNKAKLTASHVSRAVRMLWQFQKEKPEPLRTMKLIKSHPQFLTLQVLAENKITHMDDLMLVDTLYYFLRLHVDHHDSLVQQLVSEAWLRIDRFPVASLSKFAICLTDQHLQTSPLMGHITHIVDQKLSSIDDARILSSLLISLCSLVSPRLRDALVAKMDHLLDTMDPSNHNTLRRVVQFLRNIKHCHRPLLEKCNKLIMYNVPMMDADDVSMILGMYQALQFSSCDFKLAAKERLTELIDSSTIAFSFSKLFVALAPMTNQETVERLETTALMMADEFTPHQALAIVEALEEIRSRNVSLLNKISPLIQRNLHIYKPVELARIYQAFFLLRYQNPELFTELRTILLNLLQRSFYPYEVTTLTRVLSMLPCPRLDDTVISRVEEVVPQCNLADINSISQTVAKWVRNDPSYRHNTPSKYVHLLQTLNRCGQERLKTADRLDLVMEELKYMSGEWFEEMLLEESVVTVQRMIEQIDCSSIPELAVFLTRMNYLSPPLMERIASETIKDIDKVHYSATYATLLPFSVLNYDPAQADKFYDVCIQRFTPHISSFDPHLLVLMAFNLAVANYFPEELIREIFCIDFLGKLDAQIETMPHSLNMRTRLRLMELNRAVCLECPEFQVPWFHEHWCQQLQNQRSGVVSPVQKQIHKMLGEVLGGINCVRVAAATPYFNPIDFELTLDKHMQPLPYSQPSTLQISDRGKVQWGTSSVETIRDELPPGAQRVAVNFLDWRAFCKNSHHLKGQALMRKRHLEILGYRVVQIPHFEWNSMELSTPDAWKDYLQKIIFQDISS